MKSNDLDFDDELDEEDVAEQLPRNAVAAVVSATDWTTETIITQLDRGNIQLNPKFQRRDAWKQDRKSRFIESLIVGLPIPQIVLAEMKNERGRFIVLDGKQRLLSILQYWGKGAGPNNNYALTGLTLRKDLTGKTFKNLQDDSQLEPDFNSLTNQSVRTVVIRNWRDSDFLHTVFLRLNTGSVTLSPQELRQALLPGEFTSFADDAAGKSKRLQELLGLTEPDPRMRDIEILARFLAFRFFGDVYPGRMKKFLDTAFEEFNKGWDKFRPKIEEAITEFEEGVGALISVFGDEVARKPGSTQFNRAIFDALIYFHSKHEVRKALSGKNEAVSTAYKRLFSERTGFLQAVERDTAGAPNTLTRLTRWAEKLGKIAGKKLAVPKIPVAETSPDATRPRRSTRARE
jgi:Protein of unknown function DUF262